MPACYILGFDKIISHTQFHFVHCSYWSDASNSECPITLCQRLVCSLRLAAIDFSFSSKEAYSQFVTLAIMSLKI
ncbi:hypothetical protein T01_9792 [Trichinella spiralis]|uniref:Uncharacterized protein n=1 Tax=Trichinella spiralis TaxID=6334 RepID=A0A0V1BMZ6_TRISP|nr:hypothetical protein T01_9792 [Trichinella spiralis]